MGSIPPFVSQIVGLFVRWLVVLATGYLAAKLDVTFTEEQIGELVKYLTPAFLMLGWAVYRHYKGRLKFLTAVVEAECTEHEIEAIVRDPAIPNPSVNTPKDEIPR